MLIQKLKEILNFAEVIEVEELDAKTYTISASATANQIASFSAFGIDVKHNIESVLFNEALQNIAKDIIRALFEKAESLLDYEIEKQTNVYHVNKDLFDMVLNKFEDSDDYSFVISNGQLSVGFQDRVTPVLKALLTNAGMVYQLGSYENIDFFVDPYMKWDDLRILMGKEKIKLYIDPVFTIKEHTGDSATSVNRTVLEFKFKFELDESKYFRVKVSDMHNRLM